jgi:hypothetical protein
VDTIVDSDFHAKLLELNDRPSLSVIRETYGHVTRDGSTLGDSEGSQWQQILPVDEGNPMAGVMKVRSGIRCQMTGRMEAQSPATGRIVRDGIDRERHEMIRKRVMQVRESDQQPRFRHYIRVSAI